MSPVVFQIRIVAKGKWHRPGTDDMTGCGVAALNVSMRQETWGLGDLCEECFSPHERARERVPAAKPPR